MHIDSKIFFKLEIIKNNDKKLNYSIHFNPNAQNITFDEHTISWTPNKEEHSFLLEALQLLEHQNYDNTIIFNKKYQDSQESNEENLLRSIENKLDGKKNNPTISANEPEHRTQWESIDRIINNKFKINTQNRD